MAQMGVAQEPYLFRIFSLLSTSILPSKIITFATRKRQFDMPYAYIALYTVGFGAQVVDSNRGSGTRLTQVSGPVT